MNQNIERLVKAPPIAFGFTNVKRVVAARAGYVRHLRSGELYRWIVELHHGRYVYIRGWFDPSRYEVRTSIFTWSANTAEQAAEIEIRPEILARKGYKETNQNVIIDRDAYQSLLAQIKQGNRDWSGFKED